MERNSQVLLTLTAVSCLVSGLLTLGLAAPATADGPGVGPPTIVAMGDSTVSGEAGRWAGNTATLDSSRVDALGNTAYWDTPTGESMPTCHRSKSAEVHIGVDAARRPVNSYNLACSGSMTTTYDVDGEPFKPGLDNFVDVSVHNGFSQSFLLAQYAQTHNVKAIVVRVGANDIGFNKIVGTCFEDWLSWSLLEEIRPPSYCKDDPALQAQISAAARTDLTQKIFRSLQTIHDDMSAVGYTQSMYSVIVETYWSPIPSGGGFRYDQGTFARQAIGGCGVFDTDASWLNNAVLPTLNTALRGAAAMFASRPGYPPVRILDDQYALNGHRLCENGVNLIEDTHDPSTGAPYRTWSDPGAINALEWVDSLHTTGGPYDPKEGAHANYFGQLAERACLRMEYDDGNPVDATCYPGGFSSPPSWPQTGAPGGPGTIWKAPPITHLPGEPVMNLGPLAPQAPPHR